MIPARESWNKDQKALLPENFRAVYTDGSGGPLGTGAGIYFGNLAEDQSIPLGKNVTVFQVETYAIQQCVSTMKSISVTGELINIYLDSQSILKALDNPKIVSRQVRECAQGLNELTKVNFVNLIWVPGHSGILSNEKADYLASTAGSEPFIGPEPTLPISYSMIKIIYEKLGS